MNFFYLFHISTRLVFCASSKHDWFSILILCFNKNSNEENLRDKNLYEAKDPEKKRNYILSVQNTWIETLLHSRPCFGFLTLCVYFFIYLHEYNTSLVSIIHIKDIYEKINNKNWAEKIRKIKSSTILWNEE